MERLGLCILALSIVEHCQIIETRDHFLVLSSKDRLPDGQRFFQERFGRRILSSLIVLLGLFIEARGQTQILGPVGFFFLRFSCDP